MLVVIIMVVCSAIDVYYPHYKVSDNADGTVTIVEYHGYIDEVLIPDTIDGKRVTSIGQVAFRYSHGNKVVIPEGIESIGPGAFFGSSFQEVIIPDSVNTIEYSAFSHSKAKHVSFVGDGSDLFLDIGVFRESDLMDIELPEGLKSIPDSCFCECYDLKTIRIPSSVKRIGYWAFGWSGLESVELSENLIILEEYVFEDCYDLKTVDFAHAKVEQLKCPFKDCSALESVENTENIVVSESTSTLYTRSALSSVDIIEDDEASDDTATRDFVSNIISVEA